MCILVMIKIFPLMFPWNFCESGFFMSAVHAASPAALHLKEIKKRQSAVSKLICHFFIPFASSI